MRNKRVDIEDITDLANELVDVINGVIERYSGINDEVRAEAQMLLRYATIIQEKSPKIATLRDFTGYKFAVIDQETGEPRIATQNEAMRLIMGYKKGSIIDVMRDWVVIDGQWVRRPNVNPDGSLVKR